VSHPARSPSTLRVLVCEDLPIWATYFPLDGYEDDYGRIEFVLCRTQSELVASIGDGYDIVLIDNAIPRTSGGDLELSGGIRAIAKITARYGRGGPLKILWTQRPDPNWIYAFVAYGGHFFLDKSDQTPDASELYEAIRAVVAGARWKETRRPLSDKRDERRIRRWRRLVALLEAGFRSDDIADRLETTAPVITTTVGQIARSLSIERRDRAFSTLVPQYAKRAGYCWVPFEYWDLAPDKEPWPDELAPIRRERE
jgi:DNA-binding NarL/FixJ family response regulator